MAFVSFAQNFEDVMLWRALKSVQAGFYIDVGANDPNTDSVTKAFYQRDWHGINIEPVPDCFERLVRQRPRDINLNVAVGAQAGRQTLFLTSASGLSTLDAAQAERYVEAGMKAGMTVRQIETPVVTLAALCRDHAPAVVHFLKIDCEGSERAALAGADFSACRPWIIVVEATRPTTQEETHREWEPILDAAGYWFVWFDGLNRFYVAAEQHAALAPSFRAPPNVFDAFIRSSQQAPVQPPPARGDPLKARSDPLEAATPVAVDTKARIAMAARCRDADGIAKVPGAGTVRQEPDGTRVQLMHNGLKVVADGYCGPWMTALIERCHGHHEPQEERVFHEVVSRLPDGATMLELGGYWAYYSAWFLRGGAGRRAVVVEPDPVHRAIGERNMALNGLSAAFVSGFVGRVPAAAESFQTEESGVLVLPRVTVPQLMAEYAIEVLDILHCDTQGAEVDVLESCRALFVAGRIRWIFLSTHAHQITGDPLTHQRCLALLAEVGMVIEAEHDVHESFSGDGLIVARSGPAPADWAKVPLSFNRYGESLFRNPAYDLAKVFSAGLDHATVEQTVRAAYEVLLLRPADDGGLRTYTETVKRTGDVRRLLKGLLLSREFASKRDAFLQTYSGGPGAAGSDAAALERSSLSYRLRRDGPLGRAGEQLLVPEDQCILPAVRAAGAWNAAHVAFVASQLDASKSYTLLDIGANIGLFSRQLLNRCRAIDRCLCVEPDPGNFAALRFNLAPFEDRDVRCVRAGLGLADGTATFYRDRQNIGNYSLNSDAMRDRPFDTTVVDVLATGPWMRRMLDGAERIVWKSDTQGNDELIISETPADIWARVQVAVVELWRIEKPARPSDAFFERVDSFPNKSLGVHRRVSTSEIADYLAATDWRFDDLFLWR